MRMTKSDEATKELDHAMNILRTTREDDPEREEKGRRQSTSEIAELGPRLIGHLTPLKIVELDLVFRARRGSFGTGTFVTFTD